MIHKWNSPKKIVLWYLITKLREKAMWHSCQPVRRGSPQPNAGQGGLMTTGRGRGGPSCIRNKEDLLLGMSVSWHSASYPLYLKRGSAFSEPVGSLHHKQQGTAGPLYGLSPRDKCASSVVQRFSDTLPWAIILLLLFPSASHTVSIGLTSQHSHNNPSRPVRLKIEPWFRGAVGSPCKHPNVFNNHAR